MAKFFTFADRTIPVQFFEENPVSLMLTASDETDARLLESAGLLQEGDKQATVEARLSLYRRAVENLIGPEKTKEILSRADNADGYAVYSVYRYLLNAYREGKSKNLTAS